MTDEKTRAANRERQRKYREAHLDEINEKRRERYNNRIEDGKCPRCGGKVKKGYTLCDDCCEYQANLNRKYAGDRKTTAGKAPAKKTAAAKAKAKAKPAAKTKTPAPKPKKAADKKPAAKPKAKAKAKPAAKAKTASKVKK